MLIFCDVTKFEVGVYSRVSYDLLGDEAGVAVCIVQYSCGRTLVVASDRLYLFYYFR